MRYQNRVFKNEEIFLDGHEFEDCVFRGCTIYYRGGGFSLLGHCDFTDCNFHLIGQAQNTARFLSMLYRIGGKGQEAVEAVFQAIRNGV